VDSDSPGHPPQPTGGVNPIIHINLSDFMYKKEKEDQMGDYGMSAADKEGYLPLPLLVPQASVTTDKTRTWHEWEILEAAAQVGQHHSGSAYAIGSLLDLLGISNTRKVTVTIELDVAVGQFVTPDMVYAMNLEDYDGRFKVSDPLAKTAEFADQLQDGL